MRRGSPGTGAVTGTVTGTVTVVAVVAALLPLLAAPAAQAAPAPVVQGRWPLATLVERDGVLTTPATVAGREGTDDGVLAPGTTVRTTQGIAASDSAALYFPGWDDGSPDDGTVSPDASQVVVPDRSSFDPQGRRFLVSVDVRPRTPRVRGESPNIVQKGRVDQGNTHEWKISVLDDLTPVCTFRGWQSRDDHRLRAVSAFGSVRMVAGEPYRLECGLAAGRATLRVLRLSGASAEVVQTRRSREQWSALWVVPDDVVSIGKKPRDTTSGDTYAGDIAGLVITRWQ